MLGFASALHRNYVGAIERGTINPTFRTLMQLADGLRVPLSELVEIYERTSAKRRQLGRVKGRRSTREAHVVGQEAH